MVDVSAKDVTVRDATASGDVLMSPATAEMINSGAAKKGDVLAVARLAAIQATKLTQQLIPLCHAIPVEAVSVDFEWPVGKSPANETAPSDTEGIDSVILRCLVHVRTTAKTGVEMEAMTAASIACLAVYDMVKSVDRGISIGPLQLLEKSGGKSGVFRRNRR